MEEKARIKAKLKEKKLNVETLEIKDTDKLIDIVPPAPPTSPNVPDKELKKLGKGVLRAMASTQPSLKYVQKHTLKRFFTKAVRLGGASARIIDREAPKWRIKKMKEEVKPAGRPVGSFGFSSEDLDALM